MMKKILIIGVLIVICFVAGYLLLGQQLPIQLTEQAFTQPTKELKLSDFPGVFKENTVIIIRENVSQIEEESAERIASNLKNLTGNKPEIINTKKVENFKYFHNLIIVGTPKSNKILREVYNMTDAIRVTEEYPGEGKGILEILRNPWNEEKVILLVEGSDEEGMVAGINELYWLQLSKKEIDRLHAKIITVIGTLKMPKASWSPSFDECFSPSPFIEANGKIYYLRNICPYLALSSEELTDKKIIVISEPNFPEKLMGKTIKVAGILEEREVEVPLRKEPNPPTKIESFNVIVVSDLKVLNGSINEESSEVIVEVPKSIKLKDLKSYNLSDSKISIPNDLYIDSYHPETEGYYIVQFKGPIYEEYKAKVIDLGGKLFDYIPENAFIVKMNESTKDKVQNLEIVRWVGIYQPAYKISPGLLNKAGNVILTVVIFSGENVTNISRKIESMGGIISVATDKKIRVLIDVSMIPEIANICGVKYIEEYVMPQLPPKEVFPGSGPK